MTLDEQRAINKQVLSEINNHTGVTRDYLLELFSSHSVSSISCAIDCLELGMEIKREGVLLCPL